MLYGLSGSCKSLAVIPINAISSARHHIADAGFIARATCTAALALVAMFVHTPAHAAGSDEPALNPAPSQGYEFTVTLADAPGPFNVVTAGAQYHAENYLRCGKIIRLAGTISRVTSHQEIKLTKYPRRPIEASSTPTNSLMKAITGATFVAGS